MARAVHAAGYTAACCTLAAIAAAKATFWRRAGRIGTPASTPLPRLAQRCDRIVVGGLSLGAVLALHLAAQRPKEVHGLRSMRPPSGMTAGPFPGTLPAAAGGLHAHRRPLSLHEREPYGIRDERIRAHLVAAMLSGDSSEAGLVGTPGPALRELWRLVARSARTAFDHRAHFAGARPQ